MTILPDDLFDFSYFFDFQGSMRELAQLAMSEPWAFLHPQHAGYTNDTPILEKYIRTIYRYQAISYNTARDPYTQDACFLFTGPWACFHTGLMTSYFQAIYALFELNRRKDTRFMWVFKGFFPAASPRLRAFPVLPHRPVFQRFEPFHPDWEIRINFSHILQDSDNVQRLPPQVRTQHNLPLLLHAAVLYGSALGMLDPSLIVPQLYSQQIQYLMPICLTDMRHCDLAMTLMPHDGFYLGTTCLTVEMAYINARMLSRPSAFWLSELVKKPAERQAFPYEEIYCMRPVLDEDAAMHQNVIVPT